MGRFIQPRGMRKSAPRWVTDFRSTSTTRSRASALSSLIERSVRQGYSSHNVRRIVNHLAFLRIALFRLLNLARRQHRAVFQRYQRVLDHTHSARERRHNHRAPIGTITKPLRWSTGTRPLDIAVDVQLPYLASTPDRVLPHGRTHGLPFPFDFARQTNVH